MTDNLPLHDNAFYVKKQRWGTYVSYRAETDQPLVTSLTEELCIHATRFYLKGLQEGWPVSTRTLKADKGRSREFFYN